MGVIKNRLGQNYGHWKVLRFNKEKTEETGKVHWDCECDCGCGTIKTIRSDALAVTKTGGCKNMTTAKEIICQHCGQSFFPKKQAGNRKYCYNCVPEENISIRQKIKLWSVEYKGNKCSLCEYDKCIDALDFHHLNPDEKDFNISDHGLKMDWPLIKEELDKCILVCANCHREIHSNLAKQELIRLAEHKPEEQIKNSKKVRCINTNEVFGSCSIAGEKYNIKYFKHIKDVCEGKRDFCGRLPSTNEPLYWEWLEQSEDDLKRITCNKERRQKAKQEQIYKTKMVRQIKVRCSTGEQFNSLKEAGEWCNVSGSGIRRALQNPNWTSGSHPITGERLHWFKVEGE